jgi:hypothetical protein
LCVASRKGEAAVFVIKHAAVFRLKFLKALIAFFDQLPSQVVFFILSIAGKAAAASGVMPKPQHELLFKGSFRCFAQT